MMYEIVLKMQNELEEILESIQLADEEGVDTYCLHDLLFKIQEQIKILKGHAIDLAEDANLKLSCRSGEKLYKHKATICPYDWGNEDVRYWYSDLVSVFKSGCLKDFENIRKISGVVHIESDSKDLIDLIVCEAYKKIGYGSFDVFYDYRNLS